jgi:hypothetical protein
MCEIWGSRGGKDVDVGLLGCIAMCTCRYISPFRRNILPPLGLKIPRNQKTNTKEGNYKLVRVQNQARIASEANCYHVNILRDCRLLMCIFRFCQRTNKYSTHSPSEWLILESQRTTHCTVESRLSDLSGTEGRSDNQKGRIIRKTNEKDEGKYQLNL